MDSVNFERLSVMCYLSAWLLKEDNLQELLSRGEAGSHIFINSPHKF